jgi:2-keto-4-pentenoate hydratase/2-oxohepta-3-ene-1,7-dioic acid hydratase in catechol pathway
MPPPSAQVPPPRLGERSDAATGLILANLRSKAGPRLAVRVPNGLLDAAAAARALRLKVPQSTDELIAGGEGQLRECLGRALADPDPHWLHAEDSAPFAPCVARPGKIVCVGLNYRRHAREVGMPEPKVPVLFAKFGNALTHHRAVVPTAGLPGRQLDYEGELVIVIGRRCVGVREADALDHVFGYCTGNDVSERGAQMASSQWLAGKTSDGFAPIGPYLVGAALVGDPNRLALETRVNGELRQSSNTADFIFNCQQLIAYCSSLFPLDPGDLIFTGTPEGVVLGMPRERRAWLQPGDVVATTIEKLGTLEFTIGR